MIGRARQGRVIQGYWTGYRGHVGGTRQAVYTVYGSS